jgi:hypothetical protein
VLPAAIARMRRRPLDPRVRALAAAIGAVRVAIGVGALLAPRPALGALGFSEPSGATVALARLAGSRDVALGVLALRSLDDRDDLSSISLACAAVDAADAASFAVALVRRDGIDRGAALGVLSATPAALVGLWVGRSAQGRTSVIST